MNKCNLKVENPNKWLVTQDAYSSEHKYGGSEYQLEFQEALCSWASSRTPYL